jgi:anaerobic selenocysteine-containing dehydrogenase
MEEYLSYRVEKSGHSWDKLKQEGVILAPHKPITVEEGLELKFDTPSGKVEFWSDQLAAKGFDPVPKYTKHPEAPPGHFRLITGRAPGHTFSRTQTNPLLHDLMPENELWVNAKTAVKLGIKNRDYVTLKNQDGISATASASRPRSASARTPSTWSTALATPARCSRRPTSKVPARQASTRATPPIRSWVPPASMATSSHW